MWSRTLASLLARRFMFADRAVSRRHWNILGSLAAGIFAAPMAAQAGLILQDTATTDILVDYFQPIGQSFIAEDASVSFAFYYETLNQGHPNDPLELRLLSGDGLGGTQLGSFALSLADGFSGFFDVDLSSIALTVGQSYTATVGVPGGSSLWGVQINDNGDPYVGGRAYVGITTNTFGFGDALDDMRFRVSPKSVPEPATLALLGIGLAGLAASCRRKQ